MAFKAALFDLDDTLLVSSAMKWLQHKTIAERHYGVTITDDTLREIWGMPLTEMIRRSYQDADDVHVILDLLLETNDEFPKGVFDDAVSSIDRLLDNGVEVGVVTSAPSVAALSDLNRHGFDVGRMLCVLGEDRCVAHKPDPAVFDEPLQLLKEKGITRDEVVYVGDLTVDAKAANSAGFNFIGVSTGLHTAEVLAAEGAKVIAPDLTTAVNAILA